MMTRILYSLLFVGVAWAFAPTSSRNSIGSLAPTSCNTIYLVSNNNRLPTPPSTTPSLSSATSLSERKWNFNQGRGPWGLKKNAEIWNGRVAQMAFVVVLLQEAITGKGVIAAVQDGDAVGYGFLGLAVLSTLGLTVWLAIKGDESDVVF